MSLGDERLATTDEGGGRIFLFPAEVRGFFRKYRSFTQVLLIGFFLIAPWIKINGHQLIHLDILNRSFSIFGHLFKAHDAPLIFLLLALATLGLAFVTSIWGRVWCGWGCPQTIFIDGVYRRIETLILGNYLEKRKLQKESWSFIKFRKISILWIIYFFISTIIAHSFVAYFVGADELLAMLQGSPKENWNAFLIVMGMTALLLFDFAWFREQFCIIACPYGRIQSLLMDNKSTSVIYDNSRGEPRKGTLNAKALGDCVNCKRCVEVCPTGIDIRRGIQMECIGCTACIDACDEIMGKVKKPKGLIRYSSEYEIEKKIKTSLSQKIFKPRAMIYIGLIFLVSIILGILLFQRDPILVTILRNKNLPFQIINDSGAEKILSTTSLHVHNQSYDDYSLKIYQKNKNENLELVIPANVSVLKANHSYDIPIFSKYNKNLTKGTGIIREIVTIEVQHAEQKIFIEKELTFAGPF